MTAPKIRVLIADDDAGLRDALADTVRSASDLELVGDAENAEAVVVEAEASRPDVVLMDARMPGGGGVVATRELTNKLPAVKVVALSAHEDGTSALQMLDAGAVAYIVKGGSEPEILDAIRRAFRGQMSMPGDLGTTAMREMLRELRERRESENALRRNEARASAIIEAVADALIIVGGDGTIELVNAQVENLFDYRREDLIGKSVEVLLPERFRHVHEDLRSKFAVAPYSRPMDAGLQFAARRKDGHEFPVDISLSPLQTDDGLKSIVAIRDTSRHKLAEESQRKSEQLFRGLLDSAPDGMVIVDVDGLIQVVNAQTEHLFGYSRAELRGQKVEMLLPDALRKTHAGHRLGYLARPQARPMGANLELYGRRKDGTEFPVDISLSPMEAETGMLVIAAVRDVTDRREAKKKYAETFEVAQRQRLFARLIAAQEDERLRIASDIHDDTIQAMTATSLRMQQLRRHLTDENQIELLSRLEDAVRESIVRLRRLMFDLRPPALDRSGLSAALRELLERLQEEGHITFTLENRLTAELSGGVRTALYRIAQEALVNVKKHASASLVTVELSTVGSGCQVRIRDDGHGFDVGGAGSKSGHLGLVSMRERAQIAGGTWSVSSPPDGGTLVEFWLPSGADVREGAATSADDQS